jgi:hypothetical protein
LLINKILKVLPTVIKKGIARSLSQTYTEISYTPEELQYVITVLGEQTFKIKDIEFIYNLIIKLQEDYIQQSSKK